MKVKIHYDYDAKFDTKYWASSEGFNRGGKSFEEARTDLIALLKNRKPPEDIPVDEEVEI